MKAKIVFLMEDRTEHVFDVEGDGQTAWYDLGRIQLNRVLTDLAANASDDAPLSESAIIIESWRTTPEEDGTPGQDKADGVASRSPLQKIRFDLIPVGPMVEVAKVFTFGAYTYGDRNWEEGFSWSRCIGSINRHFFKWCLGETNDDESGLNHLAHVVANCLFLLQYTITKKGTDDRQKMPAKIVACMFKPVQIKTGD